MWISIGYQVYCDSPAGPKVVCTQSSAKVYQIYHLPFLFYLSSTFFLYLWINSYLVSPNAYYFLGEDGSWGTEAVDIFADSKGRAEEMSHVSNHAGLSSQEAHPKKVPLWMPSPAWNTAKNVSQELCFFHITGPLHPTRTQTCSHIYCQPQESLNLTLPMFSWNINCVFVCFF